MTKLKPETARQRVELAIYHLRQARELLKEADAPKATTKVRLAITSTVGALRHAENAPYRAARRARFEPEDEGGRRQACASDFAH